MTVLLNFAIKMLLNKRNFLKINITCSYKKDLIDMVSDLILKIVFIISCLSGFWLGLLVWRRWALAVLFCTFYMTLSFSARRNFCGSKSNVSYGSCYCTLLVLTKKPQCSLLPAAEKKSSTIRKISPELWATHGLFSH